MSEKLTEEYLAICKILKVVPTNGGLISYWDFRLNLEFKDSEAYRIVKERLN